MGKVSRAILLAMLLAVGMLATGSAASADSGKGQKSTGAKVEVRISGGGVDRSVTWE